MRAAESLSLNSSRRHSRFFALTTALISLVALLRPGFGSTYFLVVRGFFSLHLRAAKRMRPVRRLAARIGDRARPVR